MSGNGDDLDSAYRRLAETSASGVPTTAEDVTDAALFLGGGRGSEDQRDGLVIDGADYVPSDKGLSYYS